MAFHVFTNQNDRSRPSQVVISLSPMEGNRSVLRFTIGSALAHGMGWKVGVRIEVAWGTDVDFGWIRLSTTNRKGYISRRTSGVKLPDEHQRAIRIECNSTPVIFPVQDPDGNQKRWPRVKRPSVVVQHRVDGDGLLLQIPEDWWGEPTTMTQVSATELRKQLEAAQREGRRSAEEADLLLKEKAGLERKIQELTGAINKAGGKGDPASQARITDLENKLRIAEGERDAARGMIAEMNKAAKGRPALADVVDGMEQRAKASEAVVVDQGRQLATTRQDSAPKPAKRTGWAFKRALPGAGGLSYWNGKFEDEVDIKGRTTRRPCFGTIDDAETRDSAILARDFQRFNPELKGLFLVDLSKERVASAA